jgi:uncharacterized protein (UPF0333 family)
MKKRGPSKAQISMEFLIVVGFAFLMTIPLVIIFFQQSQTINTEVTASQADKVASEIRDAADEVYYLGSPSKKTITIYVPEGVKSITLLDNKIIFLVDSPGGDYELVKWSAANLSGGVPASKGLLRIAAESNDNNTVSIIVQH